ncbi:DUF1642 domain-containing protein [Streptococcus gallolyticus subsp. gallolyticus]|uniref:DUF1642 domain-containing protein n=1 Tax=Streptococcus gallolyticus TaxID=315405 RepID=UPI002283B45C|nr:DUF1642 domain-containing protein [Streptococcus gallolyticus]MCY7179549.1 DUF1642 domain-containing protein [Streptococcus gallolyticus subsp. gallolyticus]
MNKQQLIKKLGYVRYSDTDDERYNYYNKGIDTAISFAKQIDEPEKPVLSKEEAEWLEHLKLIGNFTHCLYVITRQGWGCDFEFRSHGKKYKLSCASENDGDENELTKNRLVNALIYGYEVKKEKLYRVELPNPNSPEHFVLRKNGVNKIIADCYLSDNWKLYKNTWLTESEIKKDFEWAWQLAKEVEEND